MSISAVISFPKSPVASCRSCARLIAVIEGHEFKRDNSLPHWHGWDAFRRGLATNLNALGVDDKTIQAILRHGNVGLSMNVYVKA
jgi:hypothetical protein